MKFIGLIYLDNDRWQRLREDDRLQWLALWEAFDKELRDHDHCYDSMIFPESKEMVTLRLFQGQPIAEAPRVRVTDRDNLDEGAAARNLKLGGLVFLKARDLNQAIAWVTNHPVLRYGAIEIKAVESLSPPAMNKD